MENITKQLSNMNYEDGSFEEMEENYRNVKHETNSIKTQVDTMGARYPWLDFRYSGNKIIEISNFPAKTFPRISKDDSLKLKHLKRFCKKKLRTFIKGNMAVSILPTLLT